MIAISTVTVRLDPGALIETDCTSWRVTPSGHRNVLPVARRLDTPNRNRTLPAVVVTSHTLASSPMATVELMPIAFSPASSASLRTSIAHAACIAPFSGLSTLQT